jgi:hypothetical protein
VTAEIHFVQSEDAPILAGAGDQTLSCACGNVLISSYQPAQFLGVGIQCGRCATVTTTPALPEGKMPPASLITAEPSSEKRRGTMTVPPRVALVGRAEMERLGGLLRPVTPPEAPYHVTPALLDQVVAAFERHTGAGLPEIEAADPTNAFVGLRSHPLAWAVRHLRTRMQAGSWACMEDAPTANAVTHVTGFLHFITAWSRHPLFRAMVATAGDRGFSLHGLALFAGAHTLALMGNRIAFREPTGYPGRLEHFDLATGATAVVEVHMDVFDRFEFPFGRAWDPATLRSAVADVVAAAQGRINLRNPGLLLLSPGTALLGYDEALLDAVRAAVQALGRKNRGLMGVAPIVLRLQAVPDPQQVRFGYGLFPVLNRHYEGETPPRIG